MTWLTWLPLVLHGVLLLVEVVGFVVHRALCKKDFKTCLKECRPVDSQLLELMSDFCSAVEQIKKSKE